MEELVSKYMRRLLDKRPLVVSVYVLIFIVSVFFALKLKVNNAVELLVSEDDYRRKQYAEFLDLFGSDEYSIVAIERKAGVFDKEFLKGVEKLSVEIEKIPHVEEVQNIIIKYKHAGKLLSIDITDMNWFKQLCFKDPLNIKTGLINKDGTVVSIIVPIVQHGEGNARSIVVPILEQTVDAHKHDKAFSGAVFHIVGQPQINYTMDKSANEAGTMFMPIFFILSIVLLMLLYKSIKAVIATILSLAFAVVFTMGLMASLSIPLSLVTTLLPIALFLILFAGIIHLLNGFFDPSADKSESVDDRLVRVFSIKWTASLMAVATTMVGFGSLVFSEVAPVKQLGVFMAIGMFVGLLTNFSLFPVLLSLFFKKVPVIRTLSNKEKTHYRTERLILHLFDHTIGMKYIVVVVGTLLGVAAGLTLFEMEFETNPINYLDPDDPARKEVMWFEKHITGSATLELMLKSDKEGAFLDPNQILWLFDFHDAIEKIDGVHAAIDISELVKESRGMAWGFFSKPEKPEEVDFYINQIRAQFPTYLNGFVTKDGKAARITVITNTIDYIGFRRIKKQVLEAFEKITSKKAPPHNFKLVPTGQADMLAGITVYLSRTMIYSFITTLIGVWLLIFLTFRSFKLTFLAILQNLFGIALMFGVMYLAGIKQSIPTIIIASIVLGIEVDNTIHLLYHARAARRRGLNFMESMRESLRITGRAIVVTNGIISVGFTIFLLSGFPPIRYFGLLVASAMAFAIGGVLIYLPALLSIFAPDFGLPKSQIKEDRI